MSGFLGIDTSNYTTSTAFFENDEVVHSKMLLPVKKGDLGLRQSDAVFHHTKQLPQMLDLILPKNIKAIGVSVKPRAVENSYMPCFLVGKSVADILGKALAVPVFYFSHQQGHVMAALHSANKTDLADKSFIAFHLSGGTSEGLIVKNGVLGEYDLISKTLDISAGQAIDRVGLMLGLSFPCGKELDVLASSYNGNIKTKVSVKNYNYSLSGIENQCEKLLENNEPKEYVAAYCINFIINTIDKVLVKLTAEYKDLPVIFSGGVASNSIMRKYFSNKYLAFFAEPEFSCDNAAGPAILAEMKLNKTIK